MGEPISFVQAWESFRSDPNSAGLAVYIEDVVVRVRAEFPSADETDYDAKMRQIERSRDIRAIADFLSVNAPASIRADIGKSGGPVTEMDAALFVNRLSGVMVGRRLGAVL